MGQVSRVYQEVEEMGVRAEKAPRRSRLVLVFLASVLLLSFGSGYVLAAADPDSLIKEGDRLYANRANLANVTRSNELYEKALEIRPDYYEALWRLARGYKWVGDKAEKDKLAIYEKSKEYAEKAVAANPKGVKGHYWLAVAIGKWGQTRGILQSLFMVKPMKKALDDCLAIDPKYAPAHHVLEELYRLVPGWPLSIGDKNKALEHALKSVQYGPNSTTHWVGLGNAYIALGKYDKAREALQHAIDMPVDPNDDVADPEADKDEARRLLKDIAGK